MLARTFRLSIITAVFSLLTICAAADPFNFERATKISPRLLEQISALYQNATRGAAATHEFTLPGTVGCSVTPLACDTDRSGTLGPGDCTPDADGTYADIWTFRGFVGQTVMITLRSESFDSYLYLANPAGQIVVGDDNSAGGLDAHINFTLTETGEWGIIVNQLHQAGGSYVLSHECSSGIQCIPQIRGTSCGTGSAGTLDINDCTRDGLPVEFWTFAGTAGQSVALSANRTSESGNLGLILNSDDGTPLANDTPDNATSSITATLPRSGTWVVAVVGTVALDYRLNIGCQAESTCSSSSDSLCLNNNRFRVTIAASDPRTSKTGIGNSIPYNDLTGFFALPDLTNNPANFEVFVKILDGRSTNGHYWVFYGGLTDFAYTITVVETTTGATKTYTKPGFEFVGGADTNAF